MIGFSVIVGSQISKLNLEKSQSLQQESKVLINYEIENDTLPVHSFCEFSLKEVTLRMACVYLGSQSACMDYCGIMQVEQHIL